MDICRRCTILAARRGARRTPAPRIGVLVRHSSTSSRWLGDTQAAVGKCIQFGLRDPAHAVAAANASRVLGQEWRGLVAGPLGFAVAASASGAGSASASSIGSSSNSDLGSDLGSGHASASAMTGSDVRWGDMDSMGHVNNTVYLRYAESSRLAYLRRVRRIAEARGGRDAVRDWPGDMAATGLGVILGRIDCQYLLPLTYPDRVSLLHAFDGYEGGAIALRCLVLSHKHQRVAARVREILPLYDYAKRRRVEVPDWMKSLLEAERVRQEESREFWIGVRANVDAWVNGLRADTVDSGREEMLGVPGKG